MKLRKEVLKLGKKFLVGYCSLLFFFTFLLFPDLATLKICPFFSPEVTLSQLSSPRDPPEVLGDLISPFFWTGWMVWEVSGLGHWSVIC